MSKINLNKTKLFKLIENFNEGEHYAHAPSKLAGMVNAGEYIDQLQDALIEFYALALFEGNEAKTILPDCEAIQ